MPHTLCSMSFATRWMPALFVGGLIAFAGCSSTNDTPDTSAGGMAGTGGATGAAGSGDDELGGAGSAGASVGTGGVAGSGGAPIDTAGSSGAGGAVFGGGNSNAGSGGAAQAGTGTGGVSSTDAGVDAGPRVNIALGQPATASSVEHAGHEPGMIDDGDPVTRWVGGTAVYPQWNQIDLQTNHDIDTVILWPYMSRAYQFLLEGSLDGTTYFTLSDQSANTTGGTTIAVSFAPRVTRFVRITISGAFGYADGWSAIDEMEIFEAP